MPNLTKTLRSRRQVLFFWRMWNTISTSMPGRKLIPLVCLWGFELACFAGFCESDHAHTHGGCVCFSAWVGQHSGFETLRNSKVAVQRLAHHWFLHQATCQPKGHVLPDLTGKQVRLLVRPQRGGHTIRAFFLRLIVLGDGLRKPKGTLLAVQPPVHR